MPPRAVAALLAFVVLPLAAGCGAGGDEEDVRGVVASYLTAAAEGNGRQACAYYTPEMRRAARAQAREQGLSSCARMLGTTVRYRLASLPGNLRRDVEAAIGDHDENDVDILGPGRARATFTAPHAAVEDTRATLVRTEDGWRIERLAN